jgi:hypothetical protein
VNLPICVVCVVTTILFLHISHAESPATAHSALLGLDYAGISAAGIATVLFLLAFEWASEGLSWASAHVLPCLLLGIVFLVLFVLAEARARRPVIPLRFFSHRTRAGAYAAAFLHGIAYSGLNYYTPLFFQGVKGESATESGVDLLALIVTFSITSTGAGYLITATKRYRALIWGGFVVATVGCGLLVLLDEVRRVPKTSGNERLTTLLTHGRTHLLRKS